MSKRRSNNNSNQKPRNSQRGGGVKREQPRKDSRSKRINADNERVDKLEKDISSDSTNKCNDISWYAKNEEILKAAASYPMATTTGLKVQLNVSEQSSYDRVVPGVMAIQYVPDLGGSDSIPLNAAKNSTYSFTVHANSRNKSYSGSDQMVIIISAAQVFSMIALGIRAYGIMKTYDQSNAWLPQALVEASGFNYADLQDNLSRMWFDLNDIILSTRQLWVPKTMPVFQRWFWLNSNVYMDAETVKSQFYMFTPKAYMQYEPTFVNTGSAAMYVNWVDDLVTQPEFKTWAQYTRIVRDMIAKLVNDEDRGLIFGDILKAYGAENIFALQPIPVDYTVVPVYDKEVLTQIENLSCSPTVPYALQQSSSDYLFTNYKQWTGSVSQYPGVNSTTIQIPEKRIINFHNIVAPTAADFMIATRLSCAGMKINVTDPFVTDDSTGLYPVPRVHGTEYVFMVIATNSYDYSPEYNTYPVIGWEMILPCTSSAGTTISSELTTVWSAFDWAPWLYMLSNKMTTNFPITGDKPIKQSDIKPVAVQKALGDFDNYTVLTASDLDKMHTAALYSELGVPAI